VFAESRYRGSPDRVSPGCLEEFQEAEDEARTDDLDFEALQREAKALLVREWEAVTALAHLLAGHELQIAGAQATQVIREHLSSDASLT
jgi:hypothetical protein